MIDHLLKYIHGESIYSYISRLHWCSTTRNWNSTNQCIFGKEEVRLHPSSPAYIQTISDFTKTNSGVLLTEATSYPLIAMGLVSSEDKTALMNTMLSNNGGLVAVMSKQSLYRLSFKHSFAFCQNCLVEDELTHGSPFWHIEHQFNGLSACPVHKIGLLTVPAGSGGVNHHYVLPSLDLVGQAQPASQATIKLSVYITKLHQYLCTSSFVGNLQQLYSEWLDSKGYMTQSGNIRRNQLKNDLKIFWSGLFDKDTTNIPNELSDFEYAFKLLHKITNAHYIKHALLMCFFSVSPALFFIGPKPANKASIKSKCAFNTSDVNVLGLLEKGLSMSKISEEIGYSIGRIKRLALRNGISIERRRKFITEKIERDVWRKSFYGQHRTDIAISQGISVGSVEQIIQSHARLSEWRRHLITEKRRLICRHALMRVISSAPKASRSDIKNRCSKEYLWLLTHDREWVDMRLPKVHKNKKLTRIDWSARDTEILVILKKLSGLYLSLSAIDREIGGHNWLLKYQAKLPLSTNYALSFLIKKT